MPRGNRFDAPHDQLGSEAQAVLAVLVFAALWPGRFPGGWVTVEAFGQAGLHLGERRSRESLKAAIRRGAARLRGGSPRLRIETRRTLAKDPVTGRHLRELDRRMTVPVSGALSDWLFAHSCNLIMPSLWRVFREHDRDRLSNPRDCRRHLTAAIRRADSLARLALIEAGTSGADHRRLARLHRLLSAGLELGIRLDFEE